MSFQFFRHQPGFPVNFVLFPRKRIIFLIRHLRCLPGHKESLCQQFVFHVRIDEQVFCACLQCKIVLELLLEILEVRVFYLRPYLNPNVVDFYRITHY